MNKANKDEQERQIKREKEEEVRVRVCACMCINYNKPLKGYHIVHNCVIREFAGHNTPFLPPFLLRY